MIVLLVGVALFLLVLVVRQQQVACGCVANVVIGLLLIGLGLFLLSVTGVIPPNLVCERGSYVSLCLN
jgi:hypothetical protein